MRCPLAKAGPSLGCQALSPHTAFSLPAAGPQNREEAVWAALPWGVAAASCLRVLVREEGDGGPAVIALDPREPGHGGQCPMYNSPQETNTGACDSSWEPCRASPRPQRSSPTKAP